MRIIFFIESLRSGGKERRLIELLSYLKKKNKYELMVVLLEKEIHYLAFFQLDIPMIILERKGIKKDPRPLFYFFRICQNFKPDLIHTWGNLPSLYSIPAVFFLKIPLVNSQIADAIPKKLKNPLFKLTSFINFKFSFLILANSYAGIDSYKIPLYKSKVIYNGVNLDRFKNFAPDHIIRTKIGLKTQFSVVMVASFTEYKDHDLFLDVATCTMSKNKDITFIAVGSGINFDRIKKRIENEKILNVILTGQTTDVESVVSVANIGVLFSPSGEGISNSILEYMALGKPVIATDAGGTKEIVNNNINGYLINDDSPDEISNLIISLILNVKKSETMGLAGLKQIEELFTVDRMGKEFEKVYAKYTITL